MSGLKSHKENKHLGITHKCDQCDSVRKTLIGLKNHKESKHLGIIHKCDQCDKVVTRLESLEKHKERKHRRYNSDYKSNFEDSTVRNQQEIIHKEINLAKNTPPIEDYACPACFFKTNDKKGFQIHTDAKHDGITYGKY